MSILQILAIIFSLFALSRVILRAKDRKLTLGEMIFWNAIWIGLMLAVIFPQLTTFVADILGIGRGVDVIIYSSIGVLFYLVFRIYIKIEEVEQEITKVVREIAYSKKK